MFKKLKNLTSPKSQRKADHVTCRQRHSMNMEQQFIDTGIRPAPKATSKTAKANPAIKRDPYSLWFRQIKRKKGK